MTHEADAIEAYQRFVSTEDITERGAQGVEKGMEERTHSYEPLIAKHVACPGNHDERQEKNKQDAGHHHGDGAWAGATHDGGKT